MIATFIMLLAAGGAGRSAVVGDFDRDGVRDLARIVRNADGVSQVEMQIGPRHRRIIIDRRRFSDPYLTINRFRGRIRSACGKGYDLDCRGVPDFVQLRGGELIYGQTESSSFVVTWTAGQFRSVQLND